MSKKYGRKGNKEGCIYNTIQKIDRKNKRLDFVCDICKNCTDWSVCNNRTGTNKCQKCIECTKCLKNNFCDRFYCYQRYTAQITLDTGERTTVANEANRTASIEKKKEIEAQLQTKSYVKKNGITIIEVVRKIGADKLKSKNIKQTTDDKDQYHYKYIENFGSFEKPIQKVTYQDVQDFLDSLTHLSQGEIKKIKAKLNAGFMQCVLDKIINYADNPMLRVKMPTSMQMKRPVEAFEIEEQKKVMSYILTQPLVKNNRCNYDEETLKNLFICAFLSAARIGELGALYIDKNIDLKSKNIIVKTTLSTENGIVIMGKTTKTGNKKVQDGQVDERLIPFGVFDEELFTKILKNQIKNAQLIFGNKEKLLFCQKDGSYIDHRSINNIFKRICREAGVKLNLKTGCHIHMTRHTAATRMLEAGVDILVIAKILGHVDDRQIRETYGHILDEYKNKQLKNCSNYYKKNMLA